MFSISGPFVGADEVTALLAQAGLFELAVGVASRFNLSKEPILESLTARLVRTEEMVKMIQLNVKFANLLGISPLLQCPWSFFSCP